MGSLKQSSLSSNQFLPIPQLHKFTQISNYPDAQAFAEQTLPKFIQGLSKRKSLPKNIRNAVTALIPQFFNLTDQLELTVRLMTSICEFYEPLKRPFFIFQPEYLLPEHIHYLISVRSDYSFVRANGPPLTHLNTDLINQSFKSGFVGKIMKVISKESSVDHYLFARCVHYFNLIEPYLDENLVVSLTSVFVDRTADSD
jgi:hypothetical protein